MFSCNSAEKETVRPVNEPSGKKINMAATTSCVPLPANGVIGGLAAINAIGGNTACLISACQLTTEDAGGLPDFILDVPTNWSTKSYTKSQLEGFINAATAEAISQNTIPCDVTNGIPVNGMPNYNITYAEGRDPATRRQAIVAKITYYCCYDRPIEG